MTGEPRNIQTRHAQRCTHAIEDRIPGRTKSLRRFAGCARAQQHIDVAHRGIQRSLRLGDDRKCLIVRFGRTDKARIGSLGKTLAHQIAMHGQIIGRRPARFIIDDDALGLGQTREYFGQRDVAHLGAGIGCQTNGRVQRRRNILIRSRPFVGATQADPGRRI